MKSRFGSEAGTAEEGQQLLARPETHYLVSVSGLPARMAGFAKQNPEQLKQVTSLKRKKREPIPPEGVQVQTREQLVDLYFGFPKTEGIKLEDKDIEFVMKLGQLDVKRKFKLKDMVYNGKLEL